MIETIWNVIAMIWMVTGAVAWLFGGFAIWIYWMFRDKR